MSRRAYIYRKKNILFFLGIFSWMWTTKFQEFFFATEFPGTLLFIRTECVICILQMIRFHYISVILFIVCQRNVNSSKTTEYNFLRQLCASKHLYVKFKFRYFHVNFAFGIVEYVYNIDSLSTKQLNNFVVNTYTCILGSVGYANFYNFFFHFFLESRSKQLFFLAENKSLWKTALLIITVIAIYM